MFSSHAAYNKTVDECREVPFEAEQRAVQNVVKDALCVSLKQEYQCHMPSCVLVIKDRVHIPRIVVAQNNMMMAEIMPYTNGVLLRVDITAGKSVFLAPCSATDGFYWDEDRTTQRTYTNGAMEALRAVGAV
jgi:hypothetical protein